MIRYDVNVSGDDKQIIFVSEASGGGPQFRLTYQGSGNGAVSVLFEMAAAEERHNGELFDVDRTAAISNPSPESIAQTAQAFCQEDEIAVLMLCRLAS